MKKKFLINNQLNCINYKELDNFLNDNIFKIEKILDNFIKKIVVIIDLDNFFFIELSIKKKILKTQLI